jgi:hypothetical protein
MELLGQRADTLKNICFSQYFQKGNEFYKMIVIKSE